LTNDGIPQVNLDQLNPRLTFDDEEFSVPHLSANQVMKHWDNNILQYITHVMRLTRGKLLKQEDWHEWEQSKFQQLDQYEAQGMFGIPKHVKKKEAIFNLVWTSRVKVGNKRKKARCACDGSTQGGQARILDYSYANCVNQTSSCIFYAVSAVENLVIFGADVSNDFAKAPPPKQGFFICPDKAFCAW